MASLNKRMKDAVQANPNMTVPWYLCAAFAYYENDRPFLTDNAFDWLAKYMLRHWHRIEHMHKDRITKDALRAGTLLNRDWPPHVPGAVSDLYRIQKESK